MCIRDSSRLENFLKNIQGNVIYVDPNELDATDSIENQGNSQTRPFKTIQRALIEAARFFMLLVRETISSIKQQSSLLLVRIRLTIDLDIFRMHLGTQQDISPDLVQQT